MKTILSFSIAVLLLNSATSLFGQDFHRFRVAAGGGIATGQNASGTGMAYLLEPSWRIRNFNVGVKGELLLTTTNTISDFNRLSSLSANGQYYFSRRSLRAFGGLGLGLFSAHVKPHDCNCSVDVAKNSIGFSPRVGVERGHFSALLEYNFVRHSKVTTTALYSPNVDTYPTPVVTYLKPNYLSMKVALLIGGGGR